MLLPCTFPTYPHQVPLMSLQLLLYPTRYPSCPCSCSFTPPGTPHVPAAAPLPHQVPLMSLQLLLYPTRSQTGAVRMRPARRLLYIRCAKKKATDNKTGLRVSPQRTDFCSINNRQGINEENQQGFSHAGDHNILQNVSPLVTFLKLTSLGFIIGIGVVGNLLISILLVKDKSLHRAPYYFLLDLCVSDVLRSAVCFPFVFTSVKNESAWTYGTLTCKVIAFLGVLSCFHTAFMLFCISVTRYLAIAHHRFYTKRLTFWTCLAVICMVWTLSVAMAFPPVLDVGTYSFIREEDQCTFQHRSFRANDSLGFMLLLALILLATQLVYLKLIFFVHDRRKMKPVQFVPAVSQNWTFHGPGASGQAAANWLAGFGRGPTPPTLLGIRQNTNPAGRRRLLVLDEFKTEKRISRMFYAMTFFFLTLWGPYLVACYWRVFARSLAVPGGYLTAAVWMSFAQAGVNPFICIFSNRELRRCFSTTLLYCRKSRLHSPDGRSDGSTGRRGRRSRMRRDGRRPKPGTRTVRSPRAVLCQFPPTGDQLPLIKDTVKTVIPGSLFWREGVNPGIDLEGRRSSLFMVVSCAIFLVCRALLLAFSL
ncbi:putative G protein-coupled receptor 85 [Arapaima gigas]